MFEPSIYPTDKEIKRNLDSLILSASEWRKIFAPDGNEESRVTELSPADVFLVGCMALAFAGKLKEKRPNNPTTVAVATDSRPTGPAMAEVIIRVLIARGIGVRYSGITVVPEVLAAVQLEEELRGFAYVSASHNPIGHNGLKLGFGDGSVAGGGEAADLITSFKDLASKETPDSVFPLLNKTFDKEVKSVFNQTGSWKEQTYRHYLDFTTCVVADSESSLEKKAVFDLLRESGSSLPIGILAELNGSARTVTIDSEILSDTNVLVRVLNGEPGEIVHRIVPEGSSLDLCREELEKAHRENPAFILGYVPDNDGDRGNLVYIDRDGMGNILHAQQVFALACLSELAFSSWRSIRDSAAHTPENGVVCVNGPTSMIIDRIAGCFGVVVERAEVGEANVVGLARELREKGKTVRVLGEGSNGGNITHPATCRDPLNTLYSVLKLLLIRSTAEQPGLFEMWCKRSGQLSKYRREL